MRLETVERFEETSNLNFIVPQRGASPFGLLKSSLYGFEPLKVPQLRTWCMNLQKVKVSTSWEQYRAGNDDWLGVA
jgi:hypothetical protein